MKNSSEAAVVFQNVFKYFERKPVLNDLSFTIPKNQISAILGPNGAGKTTSVRCMTGLLKIDKGKIEVFGNDVSSQSELIRTKVGLVPQTNSGYTALTAKDNLEFMARLYGTSRHVSDELIDRLTHELSLTDRLGTAWGKLSGGEQRAFSLIRAILTGAQLLILDEPTAGLDMQRAHLVRNLIKSLLKEGKTIILSSHIITDIEQLSSNIIIMKNGQAITQGDINTIISQFSSSGELDDAILQAFEAPRIG